MRIIATERRNRRLKAWEDELKTDRCGLAWFAPIAIARLKPLPIEETFGGIVGAGAKILDWGKIPK